MARLACLAEALQLRGESPARQHLPTPPRSPCPDWQSQPCARGGSRSCGCSRAARERPEGGEWFGRALTPGEGRGCDQSVQRQGLCHPHRGGAARLSGAARGGGEQHRDLAGQPRRQSARVRGESARQRHSVLRLGQDGVFRGHVLAAVPGSRAPAGAGVCRRDSLVPSWVEPCSVPGRRNAGRGGSTSREQQGGKQGEGVLCL